MRHAVGILMLVMTACGGAPRASVRSEPEIARVAAPREEPIAPAIASLSDRSERARDQVTQSGGAILAAHHERLDGAARVHLVLEQGRCYRAWVGAERAFEARLDDEHGHTVASGASDASLWLGEAPICPRWSGSFELVVDAEPIAQEMEVLLVAVDL